MAILVWLRRDLRVQDNSALANALVDARQLGLRVTAVYVHDPDGTGNWAPGGASRWYLDRALRRLQAGAWDSGSTHHWLRAWQHGETGYDLVDAGMHELWETGRMHNRVRMVTASFLTKNLGIHWREGARWFWDTLVDADLANNILGWQWVAGCGTDAAPYYRIFNPEIQAHKFDPQGVYCRRWLPKGARPKALIDLQDSRSRALARYQVITKGHAA